jgi:hypothetical protein
VRTSNRRIEDCEDSECGDYFANGVACNGSSCSNCVLAINPCCDVCDDIEYYRCGNSTTAIDDFAVPKYDGGEHLGKGKIPRGTDDYKMARSPDPKNFIEQSDDAVLFNDTGSGWQGIYGTSVDSPVVNFQNSSLTGHTHPDTAYSVNTGNITTKQFITVNNVSTGSLTPVNSDVTEVMTVDFNVATPSIQMMYIIKAY